MSLKFTVSTLKGEFADAMKTKYRPLAEAGSETIRVIADEVKTEARADIAAAGFGKRWQNALRVDVYPKKGASLDAAAFLYHKISYAGIFEKGGVIAGKPLLWLPLASSPKKIGRYRMTPDRYRKEIGPLFAIRRPGKPPLLAGKMQVSEGQARSGKFGKVTVAKLKGGRSGQGIVRTVPLFVGIDQVKIKDKFSIAEIVEKASGRIASVFASKVAGKDFEG